MKDENEGRLGVPDERLIDREAEEAAEKAELEREQELYNREVLHKFQTGFGGFIKFVRESRGKTAQQMAEAMNVTIDVYARMEKGGKPLNKAGFLMYALGTLYPEGEKPEGDPNASEDVIQEARRTMITAYDLSLLAYNEMSVDLIVAPQTAMEIATYLLWHRAGKPQSPAQKQRPVLYGSQGERIV